jgi:hypothetical protein
MCFTFTTGFCQSRFMRRLKPFRSEQIFSVRRRRLLWKPLFSMNLRWFWFWNVSYNWWFVGKVEPGYGSCRLTVVGFFPAVQVVAGGIGASFKLPENSTVYTNVPAGNFKKRYRIREQISSANSIHVKKFFRNRSSKKRCSCTVKKIIKRIVTTAGLWIRIDSIRIRIQHFCSIRIRIQFRFRIRIQAKTELSNTIFFLKFCWNLNLSQIK